MTIKENAMARITPQDADAGRYQPPDPVLSFLASL
jgi:integrase/recombinase XerD